MVHQLADDEVQLQIGCRLGRAAADEATRLCVVGGEHAGAAAAPVHHTARNAHRRLGRHAEQVLEVRRVVQQHHVGVVVQVLAHARQIVHHGNAVLLQLRARANAREHQQLGRQQRPGAEQHFARGAHFLQLPTLAVLHAHRTAALHQHPRGLRAGDDLQVRPAQVRREVALGGAVAFPILVGDLVQAHAFLVWPVEVQVVRVARLHPGVHKALAHAVRRAQVGHVEGPALPVQGAADAFVVFGTHKVGQHIGPAPAGVALGGPVVVVGRLATHVNHGVDRAAAAQHLAPGLVAAPAVEPRLRHRALAPTVELQPRHRGQPCGAVDQHAAVGRSGFQQAHPHGGVLRQTPCQHGPGRAPAHHDVVEHVCVFPRPSTVATCKITERPCFLLRNFPGVPTARTAASLTMQASVSLGRKLFL